MADLRKDPVSGAWVIISPEQEPGVKLETFHRLETPVDECPFCRGHEPEAGPTILAYGKNGEMENGDDWQLRVVPNRVPVLRTDEVLEREGMGMFDRMTGVGAHEIVIDSPEHDHTLKDFSVSQIRLMLTAWRDRLNDLFRDPRLRYVAIVRNQGRRAGARISHPHSQIIVTPMIPIGVKNELTGAREYFEYKERCVFCDLLDQEGEERTRLLTQNRGFLAFCPFASRYPFEVWFLPRRHHYHYGAISDGEIEDLAESISIVSKAIAHSLLDPDLNLVLKTSPNPPPRKGKWTTLEEDFHWHIELVPRVTRWTGYEWATGMVVNPTPPEKAAAFMRESLYQFEGEPRAFGEA